MNEQPGGPDRLASPKTQLADINAQLNDHRAMMHALAKHHPELTIAQQMFEHVFREQAETPVPLMLRRILDAHVSTLKQLKAVINPTGLPLDVTPDGRIKSRTFRSAAVISTDLEGFTPMTYQVPRVWDTDIFTVLSYTYYANFMEVLKKHNCHLYSYAGDGTMILSREEIGENGRVQLPALDNAVLCVADAHTVLQLVSDVWKEMGLCGDGGKAMRTRFGIKFGPVTIGDALAPDGNPQGMCAEFYDRFRRIVAEHAPHYGPPADFSMRIWGVHGMSPIQNQAARLQSALKEHPEHVCILVHEDVQQLCPPLQKIFEPLGRCTLKGVSGDADIHGMRPVPAGEILSLEQACRAFYMHHDTYH